MWKNRILAALAIAGGVGVVRSQVAGRFVEEPPHEIERRIGDSVEIRRYAPRILAVTRVASVSRDEATNEGFRRLAGYIFGGNERRASIAMTTPVTETVAGGEAQSERIAMTAPVTQAVARDGAWEITFTMPSASRMETMPVPHDRRVELEQRPGERYGVLRYSGLAGSDIVRARTDALRALLDRERLETIGDPISARYDPPWTLPFLRRNEIWLRLTD